VLETNEISEGAGARQIYGSSSNKAMMINVAPINLHNK
jgi:hypothetical protein